jgi:hypothetical protein
LSNAASHPEIIALLELYLESAKTKKWAAVAIAMVGHPNVACSDFVGEVNAEEMLDEAVARLGDKVKDSIDKWQLPEHDPTLDRSYVAYNVANGPMGFDFLIWLADAEMTRRRHGAPSPLKVGFWCGKDADTHMNRDQRRLWLSQLFRPMLAMIGAVEDDRAIHGHHKPLFVPRDICTAVRNGEQVPIFRSGLAPRSPGAVTITLRESTHWPHRNSNLKAWLRFAEYLRDRGEHVVIVRDTEKAFDNFADFETNPRASVEIRERMALYESAKCNCFVGNGPVGLAMFSTQPWLQFVRVESPDAVYTPNMPKFWKESIGVEVGDQYPWSSPSQRIIWKPDDYENLVDAWEELSLTKELSYGT